MGTGNGGGYLEVGDLGLLRASGGGTDRPLVELRGQHGAEDGGEW